MARKTNPENPVTGSSASAASARSRRGNTTARPQHASPSAETLTSARELETAGVSSETSARTDTVAVNRELAHEQIARLAYALWEARGCQGGSPEEDWRLAEEQLKQGA